MRLMSFVESDLSASQPSVNHRVLSARARRDYLKARDQPVEHFSGGMLQGLIERTGIADGEPTGGGNAAGPADALALQQFHGECDFGGCLDAGADDLAIALGGMNVT